MGGICDAVSVAVVSVVPHDVDSCTDGVDVAESGQCWNYLRSDKKVGLR